MNRIIAAALCTAAFATAASASVVNGSFEDPGTVTGNWATYGVGSTALTGWSIDRGSIDLINAFWQHSDGSYSVNIDGRSPATISQMLTGLTVGQDYELTFDMAANTADPNSIVGITASVGRDSMSYDFDSTGFSRGNMGWASYSLGFTASSESLLLSFASNSASGPYGAALDNVGLTAVPLPASGLLLLGALGAMTLRGRKKS